MTEVQSPASAGSGQPSDEVIAQHVRGKEFEIRLKSRALAGLIMGALVWLLAATHNFTAFGDYSGPIAGAMAFISGCWMGERAVFALLGGAVTFFFMSGGKNG